MSGGSDRIVADAVEVALTLEHTQIVKDAISAHLYEWQVYNCYRIPAVHHKGRQGDFYILVMDIWPLGCLEFFIAQSMPPNMVACIAVEAISILEKLHMKGELHTRRNSLCFRRSKEIASVADFCDRWCKRKGGQNGLFGSALPRNFRRSSEVVVVEEQKPVVLTDERRTKPRKHKKTGRSKKEKQSSVPLLPSPPCLSSDLSEDVCQGDLERIRENINDLIMWRDVAKSTL
ncbi:Protein kinase-like domain protein [Raphanus sativus]|nr:Protein kinase-like domain protein [Raphanus sativus]